MHRWSTTSQEPPSRRREDPSLAGSPASARPAASSAEEAILLLQRVAGNAAVGALLEGGLAVQRWQGPMQLAYDSDPVSRLAMDYREARQKWDGRFNVGALMEGGAHVDTRESFGVDLHSERLLIGGRIGGQRPDFGEYRGLRRGRAVIYTERAPCDSCTREVLDVALRDDDVVYHTFESAAGPNVVEKALDAARALRTQERRAQERHELDIAMEMYGPDDEEAPGPDDPPVTVTRPDAAPPGAAPPDAAPPGTTPAFAAPAFAAPASAAPAGVTRPAPPGYGTCPYCRKPWPLTPKRGVLQTHSTGRMVQESVIPTGRGNDRPFKPSIAKLAVCPGSGRGPLSG